jgi:hypothetical protein
LKVSQLSALVSRQQALWVKFKRIWVVRKRGGNFVESVESEFWTSRSKLARKAARLRDSRWSRRSPTKLAEADYQHD